MGENEGKIKSNDIVYEPLQANLKSEHLPEILRINYVKTTTDFAKAIELEEIAKKINELHENGSAFKDITILLAKIKNADEIAQVLEINKIPYTIIDGNGFYDRQEILDVLNLLRFLSDNNNSLALSGILRSPYFAIDDETLTKLYLQNDSNTGNLWETLLLNTYNKFLTKKQSPKLTVAVKILKELVQGAQTLSVQELFKLIDKKLLPQVLLLGQKMVSKKLLT